MNFLMTCYIYPLSEKIILSQQLKFYLDNPRTEEEISLVKHFLLKGYELNQSEHPYFPKSYTDDYVTLEGAISDFRNAFSNLDEYIAEFFEAHENEDALDIFAKMWVIARFDDEGETQILHERAKEIRESGRRAVIMLESDHPLIRNRNRLGDYSYLLSALVHSEQDAYSGQSFIMDLNQIDDPEPPSYLWTAFLIFIMASREYKEGTLSQDSSRWTYLPYAIDNIVDISHTLDNVFTDVSAEKLLYIGNILKVVAHELDDIKVKILMLTSIIELLLTHNPDFNRFNIEDSISKQFQLKSAILIYMNDKSRNLNSVKNRLKVIYQQRSNIAHGNFGEIDKYISRFSKKEGEEEYFSDLVTDLYTYIRAILEEYLKDKTFVEFLKDG